jgi:hypothetical protein
VRVGLIGLAFCWLVATPALACPNIPAVGSAIDGLLKQTRLKETDRRKVEDLQKQMNDLAAAGKEKDARKAEEDAMHLLGFEKTWLKCGPDTFMWMKMQAAAATPPAPAPKP